MSVKRLEWMLACDERPLCRHVRFPDDVPPAVARLQLQSHGWRYEMRDGVAVDICPDHGGGS